MWSQTIREQLGVLCAGDELQDLTGIPEISYAEPGSSEAQKQAEVRPRWNWSRLRPSSLA